MSPLTELVLSVIAVIVSLLIIIIDIINYYRNKQERLKINYQYINGRFSFNIKKKRDGYRIYIDKCPSYINRNQSLALTHRHFDGKRYYICWTENILSYKDAEAIANAWCKGTLEYIKTGNTF